MFLGKVLRRRNNSVQKSIIAQATRPVMESLEGRRMLSVSAWSVPLGTAVVHLRKTATAGEVEVFLDANTGTPDHKFTGLTDTDELDSSIVNLKYIDEMPGAFKPSGGILMKAGGGGTLEIDAGPTDQLITMSTSLSTGSTVTTNDYSVDPAHPTSGSDSIGAGMSHLIIRTNDNVASDYFPANPADVTGTNGTQVDISTLASATSLRIETGAAGPACGPALTLLLIVDATLPYALNKAGLINHYSQ